MIFINKAAVNAEQVQGTTTLPANNLNALQACRYSSNSELFVNTTNAPAATDQYTQGCRFAPNGAMYVRPVEALGVPANVDYDGGLAFDGTTNALLVTTALAVRYVNGWPLDQRGFVCMNTTGGPAPATPIFFAPLTTTLVPTTAVNPAATFVRATTAYVSAYAAGAVAGATQLLIPCASNEARFQGARRVSPGVWSATLSDATPIPDATLLGYMAEGPRTNLCIQSQFAFAWQEQSATQVKDFAVAPDGTTTACKISEFANLTQHTVYQNMPAGAAGATYTESIYVKAGSIPYAIIRLGGTPLISEFAYLSVDLSTGLELASGVVGSATLISKSITPLPNGWYRITITGTTGPASVDIRLGIGPTNAAGSAGNISGNAANNILAWGGQCEVATFASSYISTTTVAVTRNQDVLSYVTAGNFDFTAGTAYGETAVPAGFDAGTNGVVFLGNTNHWPFGKNAATTNAILRGIGGGTAITLVGSWPNDGAQRKMSGKWGPNLGICISGGAVVSTALAGAIGGAEASFVVAGGTQSYYTTKNLKIYNVALTDAEMVALTA